MPLGSIGFDQEQLEAIPGGIDYSAGVPNELDTKIKEKLNEHINTISNVGDVDSISSTLSSIQNNATVSQFGQIFNPETGQFNIMWSGNPEELQKASEGISERLRIVRGKIAVARQNNEDADLSRLEDEEQRLKIRLAHHRNMENLSRAGNKLYALLHREAYVKTVREMTRDANGDLVVGNDYISLLGEKMADAIKLASNRRRESQTQFTQDALIDIVDQENIGQDYLFADRKSLLLFIDAMGGVQGGILQRGTRLRYTTSEGEEDTVTVQKHESRIYKCSNGG